MPPILVDGTPLTNCPIKPPWIPNVGVGKTGCPGGTHPVAVVVDPVEDQAVAIVQMSASPLSLGHQPVKSPDEVLLMSVK